ncbi:MAG: metal-dependent transcriptional regulator [Bacteroidota bacterium]
MSTFLNIALIAFSLLVLAIIIVLISRQRTSRRRILTEDALKHIYHCEYGKVSCTINSLAGAMGKPQDAVAAIVSELTDRRYVNPRGQELVLTDQGREYALSVIRSHRLWERYLADETMVREIDWHKEAELQEHKLSSEEAESLSKRLGNPVFDPHGDPIPSPGGQIPREIGFGLERFREGDTVQIVHVEDEPPTVYAELLRLGLHPGMKVVIRERSELQIVLDREGERIELTPVVAANLQVRKEGGIAPSRPRKTLASLSLGNKAVVAEISPACRGLQRRRLMDLGIVPGTTIEAEMRSPGGDPTAYRIRGATIALRREHADLVFVE